MATHRTKSICRHPGCNRLIDISGFCGKHQGDAVGWFRTSTRSASQRGYGSYWRKLRASVIQRDMSLCQECLRHGRFVTGNDVDHIVPKALGGSDDMDNLQTLCRACHKQKTVAERLAVR